MAPEQVATETPPINQADASVEVHDVELPEVHPVSIKAPAGQIDILLETAVPVTATLGKAEVMIRDLLQLGAGSVLKLERRVGEPVDLFLRGVRFATGHIVVVGDQLGVRIKEIIPSPPAGKGSQA
jgi:flagellar motor switch protein FliN/FliY